MNNSGIYKLNFPDGSYYIGQSRNIGKRLEQHITHMEKGTHSKRVQECFNRYGPPKYNILIECHYSHLDLLESYFIQSLWSDRILNANIPIKLSDEELVEIDAINSTAWKVGSSQLICRVDKLRKRLEGISTGRLVEELENENYSLTLKLQQLRNRGILARIFNWE